MDGFQDGGYIWAQGVLQYHLIEVPWFRSAPGPVSKIISDQDLFVFTIGRIRFLQVIQRRLKGVASGSWEGDCYVLCYWVC